MSSSTCLRISSSALFAFLSSALASAQTALWSETVGTPAQDFAAGAAPDGAGGLVAIGRTAGSLFGQNNGSEDIWIARRDAVGALLWARQFGGDGIDRGWDLALDGSGDLFACGETQSALGAPPAGELDAWLARLDPAGQTLWLTQFGSAGFDRAQSVQADGGGGTFASGLTTGSLFGPNQGEQDAWIARFDAAGGLLWAAQFGGPGNENLLALVPDGSGGAFVTGATTDTLFAAHKGGWDAVLLRIDAAGNVAWSRQFGTSEDDLATCLARDGLGGVYVGLATEGSFAGPSAGDDDVAVARYSAGGQQLWKRQFGSTKIDVPFTAVSDGQGGVVLGGTAAAPLGDPFTGSGTAWLARIDAGGHLDDGAQFGDAVLDVVAAGVEDGSGGVLLAGMAYDGGFDPDVWMMRFTFECSPAASYCTASATSIPGCTAQLGASGAPSVAFADGFRIASGAVPGGNNGLLVFGNQGPAATPLGTQGGFLCVQPPFYRSQLAASSGTAGACDGGFAFTLQDLVDASPIVVPGAGLHVQLWARDAGGVDGFLLSDGLTFDVCP
jgi:hypothetical protein